MVSLSQDSENGPLSASNATDRFTVNQWLQHS